ncbi:hypothetical protein MKQ68_00370 [Chitinophaga horti]|uniref:Uncharacterized protein n=1 Tax=Chitinophaga horti TaxID=2920382 RepID=A0ABY6J5H8_9BACT|nr:hypothetical protein [Chitinophaga horti]UYQ93554.1 hypothetical protein MKQ68_00370 [Chitinophaga horti]
MIKRIPFLRRWRIFLQHTFANILFLAIGLPFAGLPGTTFDFETAYQVVAGCALTAFILVDYALLFALASAGMKPEQHTRWMIASMLPQLIIVAGATIIALTIQLWPRISALPLLVNAVLAAVYMALMRRRYREEAQREQANQSITEINAQRL